LIIIRDDADSPGSFLLPDTSCRCSAVPPCRIIFDPIRRVGDHRVRLDAAEHALDVRRDRAVAAEETMPPEDPQITRLRHRVLGSRRRAST
jgi:hypothetical protein